MRISEFHNLYKDDFPKEKIRKNKGIKRAWKPMRSTLDKTK